MGNRLSVLLVPGLALLVELYISLSVFSGSGNQIGAMAAFLMVLSCIFGLVAPRASMYWLILLCAFSDLAKRLMTVFGDFGFLDVTKVLAIAPMAVAGAMAGSLFHRTRTGFTSRDVWLLLAIGLIGVATLVRAMYGEPGVLGVLKQVATEGAFACLIFIIPTVFDRAGLIKLLRFASGVFVIVACYGLVQKALGMADFEHAYLVEGFTGEIRHLAEVELRVFSTLNSAASLSTVMAICFLLEVALWWNSHRRTNAVIAVAKCLLFLSCMFFTYTRTGYMVCLSGFLAMFLIRYAVTTLAMYASAVLVFVLLVFAAENLIERAHDIQHMLTGERGSGVESPLFRVVTWTDRLESYRQLTEAASWTPFGREQDLVRRGDAVSRDEFLGGTFSHDLITTSLFAYGYVPMSVGIVLCVFFLVRLHRWGWKPGQDRVVRLGFLAIPFGVATSALSSPLLLLFPVNFFFYTVVAYLVIDNEGQSSERSSEALAAEMIPTVQPAPAYR